MKKWMVVAACFGLLTATTAQAGYVRGYTRKDGTYVAPYYRGGASSGASSSVSTTPSAPVVTTTPTGVKCGNSYISAGKVCRIGTTTYKTQNFGSCDEANENGFADIKIGSPAYAPALDRDNDGIACESQGADVGAVDPRYYVATATASPSTSSQTTGNSSSVPNSNTASCPEFKLSPFGIMVTVPAVFPNPQTTRSTDDYICGGWEIHYSGSTYDYPRDITIKAPSWMEAWKRMSLDLDSYLQINYGYKIDFSNDKVVYVPASAYPGEVNKDIVVGLTVNGGQLVPVVFNGVVTPQAIPSGKIGIYQKAGYSSFKYAQFSIDTSTNTIIATKNAVWPR